MPIHFPGRRDFLRLSGAGIAGASVPFHAGQAQTTTSAPAAAFDVRTFGAAGDGKTIDSTAINRAIEAAVSAGGGTVRFPAGSYLSYSIHLKSNVALYFEPGATIIAAETSSSGSYDAAEPKQPWEAYQDFGHNHWHNSLIWGEGLENVSILGPGFIWGRGLSRGEGNGPVAEDPGVANKAIALKHCRNVTLRDFSIFKGGHFGVLATGVDNLTIDNLRIDTDRDGIDIDCCRNVRVSNCSINSPWDDAICPKSSFALGHARATENLIITNCYVTGIYKMGTMLDGTWQRFAPAEKKHGTGRIKFGTESNGGFRNVTISNCVFEGCYGLALETVDGALLEDFTITNITMRDVLVPLFLRLGSRMRGPAGVPVGALRRVLISNLACSNVDFGICSTISGIPDHPIEDIQLNDIYIEHQGGGTSEEAKTEPAEAENKYPEPDMFGRTPAQGFFVRHAKNVCAGNVEIRAAAKDMRPAFVLQNVHGADFFRVRAPREAGVPMFVLRNVDGFSCARCRNVPDTELEHVEQKSL